MKLGSKSIFLMALAVIGIHFVLQVGSLFVVGIGATQIDVEDVTNDPLFDIAFWVYTILSIPIMFLFDYAIFPLIHEFIPVQTTYGIVSLIFEFPYLLNSLLWGYSFYYLANRFRTKQIQVKQ